MTKMNLNSFKSSNEVRNNLIGLYGKILDCPHFQGKCAPCIKKVSHPFGPEISFVGKHYGEGDVPRFLFGRVAPNWPDIKPAQAGRSVQDRGWEMGNRLSIKRYLEVILITLTSTPAISWRRSSEDVADRLLRTSSFLSSMVTI